MRRAGLILAACIAAMPAFAQIIPGRSPGFRPGFQFLFPSITPVYSCAYTSGATCGQETDTRSTAATYFNSAGALSSAAANTPRFDYDPVALVAKGLLTEEARSNIVNNSGDLSQASWQKASSTVATGFADPGGGTSAGRVTATGGNGFFYAAPTQAASSADTTSFWVRKVSGSGNVIFIKQDGSAFSPSFTVTSTWARYSYSPGTTWAAGANIYAGLGLVTSGDVVDVAYGDLEAGSFATSYIPTTTAAVSRGADTITSGTSLTNQLAAGPSILESTDVATGVTSRTGYAAGAFAWPQNKWLRHLVVYPAGTSMGYVNSRLTVGGPY